MTNPLNAKIDLAIIFSIAITAMVGTFVTFRMSYIISGGCFLLSVVSFYVLINEINYRKGNDELLEEKTTPRETSITLSKSVLVFKCVFYSFYIFFGAYISYLSRIDSSNLNQRSNYFLLAVGIVLSIGYAIKLIRTMLSKRKIIINSQGINYNSKHLIFWSDIKNECVVKKQKSTNSKHIRYYDAYYLSFKNKKQLVELCIEDYDITNNQLTQLLKIYRSRHSS